MAICKLRSKPPTPEPEQATCTKMPPLKTGSTEMGKMLCNNPPPTAPFELSAFLRKHLAPASCAFLFWSPTCEPLPTLLPHFGDMASNVGFPTHTKKSNSVLCGSHKFNKLRGQFSGFLLLCRALSRRHSHTKTRKHQPEFFQTETVY